jgi:FkbM family methyltransferase
LFSFWGQPLCSEVIQEIDILKGGIGEYMNTINTIYKKLCERLTQDSLVQFISRIGVHLSLIYPKVKARLHIRSLKNKYPESPLFLREINGSKMLLDTRDRGLSTELLLKGIREPLSTAYIQNEIKPGDICIDIGANIGYYALLEAKIVGPTGKVYAIEPVASNIELLKKNIQLNNYENIMISKLAIGDKNQIGYISLSSNSNLHSLNDSVILDKNAVEEVEIITLDDFLNNKEYPSLIRMDTEGYEDNIIQGLKKTLSKNTPLKIFIEFHSCFMKDGGLRLLETLRDYNFKVKAIFIEQQGLIKDEYKFTNIFYNYFMKKLGSFNNNIENYDIEINDIIKDLDKIRRNFCEIFFVRK